MTRVIRDLKHPETIQSNISDTSNTGLGPKMYYMHEFCNIHAGLAEKLNKGIAVF